MEDPTGFTFEHGGRTFICRVEKSPGSASGHWWWFSVSTENHQRHAPFRADPTDTQEDVSARIVSYYDTLLERRAAPYQSRWQARGARAPVAAPSGDAQPTG